MNISDIERQFLSAAKNSDLTKVKYYFDLGANINSTDKNFKTSILIATELNNVEMVRWLVQEGAEIDFIKKPDGTIDNTPFLYAGANGLDDILDILIPQKPDVNILNGYGGNALIPACEKGFVNTVKKLLENTNVDVNSVNNLGLTALLEAIILGNGAISHQQIIKLLLKHGANSNIGDSDGVLPITHARKKGFKEIVDILETI
ncbi:MAG: putative ankyrin repeat protein [Candidatus Heimdallarchaeota archaeon LC_2]|nr:MAG: putative ankyrin repeat protein [Candidatus Heimdallarchaeota archaeon LC_2]